jgi:hypothetical protein
VEFLHSLNPLYSLSGLAIGATVLLALYPKLPKVKIVGLVGAKLAF